MPGSFGKQPENQSSVIRYMSVPGDTLWSLAYRFLGDGARWPEIYNINQTIIETVAKTHGFQSSEYGRLLIPGTWLDLKTK